MSKINISSGNVSGNNVQMGHTNTIYNTSPLSSYHKELLTLFDEYCTSDTKKEELLTALHKIETEDKVVASQSANKILSFLKELGTGLVTSGLYDILRHLVIPS